MAMRGFTLYRTRFHPPGGIPPFDVVTPVPPEKSFKEGLARESILGSLPASSEGSAQKDIRPGDFTANPGFIDFLHQMIAKHGAQDVTLQAAANSQGDGYIYILDGRTPTPDRDVPPEDIIGAFSVEHGTLQPAAYQPNGSYVLFTANGFPKLPEPLMNRILEELLERNASASR